MSSEHAEEIESGRRFSFGKNWANFLATLDEPKIGRAESALQEMLDRHRFDGARFLDAGSGSGLSSLAAFRLGAEVVSFDYDPQSVACTRQLHAEHAAGSTRSDLWHVEEGSVLDSEFLSTLGSFDVVYSWGVLHHTGKMYAAMNHLVPLIREHGVLFIALYNDQGLLSKFWTAVKRLYCMNLLGRTLVTALFVPLFFLRAVAAGLVKHRSPWGQFARYHEERGMSIYHDWIDWLGGYPFEVATPKEVVGWAEQYNLSLVRSKTTRRLGCNEFVFVKMSSDSGD